MCRIEVRGCAGSKKNAWKTPAAYYQNHETRAMLKKIHGNMNLLIMSIGILG